MSMGTKKKTTLAEDIASVYKELGGRSHLLTLCKGDEKFFKSLLLDQNRLELRKQELELANKGAPKGNTTFIIKGLNEEQAKSVSVEAVPEEVLRLKSSMFPVEAESVEEIHEDEEQDGTEG